jgi:hypothetical protein
MMKEDFFVSGAAALQHGLRQASKWQQVILQKSAKGCW